MAPLPYIVATAGHVDHGKSALVRALTGTDPDRLPEEKARGITIDLGFAHLRLASPYDPAIAYQVAIVDVPGHEDFVKNMVAGIGSIDLALLVVAADDLWKPQTEEHLQILAYLGVTRAVVALTKIDLLTCEEAAGAAHAAVREKLRGSPFADAPIVGTSVPGGRGLEELKAALAGQMARTPPQRDVGKPRLPVDRAFVLKGVGTVVTGTLTGGRLHRGQAVVLQPGGRPSRVRGLQSHGRDAESCPPGSRVALNLPDLAVDAGRAAASEAAVRRGDVIAAADLGSPHGTLDVLLDRSARAGGGGTPSAPRLLDGAAVHLHHGSGDFAAKVVLLGVPELLPGGRALAQLRFDSPLYAFAGDRFIVRDWPARHTLAGGVVLDPDAARRGFHSDRRRAFLSPRAGDFRPEIFVETLLARDGATRQAGLLAQSRFSAKEVTEAVSQLVSAGKAVLAGEMLVAPRHLQALRQTAEEAIRAEHRDHPESQGLKLADLRSALDGKWGGSADGGAVFAPVFEAIVAWLCRSGFARAGTVIRSTAHRPALPPHLQAAGARLRSALSAKPFEPPSRKELSRDPTADKALRFLIDTGEAVAVGEDFILLTDALARATQAARQYITANGPATASQLRQALGTTRRVVMPLVEYWDHHGVTLRRGDVRVLK